MGPRRKSKPSPGVAVLRVAVAGLLLANVANPAYRGASDGWLVVLGWAALVSTVLAAAVEGWRYRRYRQRQRAETEV
jgi:hypothetical protein